MKKKILLSTLALTMAFSTMAALPFADQGIFKKAGFTRTAEASAANSVIDTLQARIGNINTILSTDDIQGKDMVTKVRGEIKTKNMSTDVEAYITANFGKLLNGTNVVERDVFKLVKSVALAGLGEAAYLDGFRQGGDYFNILKELAPGATTQDAVAFANIVFAELLNDKAIVDLAGAMNSDLNEAVNAYLTSVLEAVLAHDNAIVAVLNKAEITADVLVGLNDLITNEIDTAESKAAIAALAIAAARAELSVRTEYFPEEYVTLETKAAGKYATELNKLLTSKASLLNGYVKWSVQGSNLVVDKTNGKISLESYTSGTYAGTVTAEVYGAGLDGQALFASAQPISVTYRSGTVSVPGGGGGGGVSPTEGLPNYTEMNQATFDELDKLAKDLASAVSDKAKADAQAKIQALFNEYLQKASTVNVLSKASDTDALAKLSLSAADMKAIIEEVSKQLKAAVETFKKAYPELNAPATVLTLDMGQTKSDAFDIALSKDLMELLKTNEMKQVRVLSKGFTTKLAVDTLQGDTNWTVNSAAAKPLSNVPVVASAVYDVNFSAPTALPTGSVFVNVPMNADFKLPKHSLQVASIANGAATNLTANNGEFEYGLTNAQTFVAITGRDVNFNDIGRVEAWAGAQIDFVASLGIVDGVGKDGYAPTKPVTRAEFAKMMALAFEFDKKASSNKIADVTGDAWYNDYAQIMVQEGLMNLNSDGTFKPGDSLNRGQIAAIAARAMQKQLGWEDVTNVDEVLSVFKDADKIHPSIRKDVALAVKHNLLIGSNGMFNPTSTTNRAEAAVIFSRLLENK